MKNNKPKGNASEIEKITLQADKELDISPITQRVDSTLRVSKDKKLLAWIYLDRKEIEVRNKNFYNFFKIKKSQCNIRTLIFKLKDS